MSDPLPEGWQFDALSKFGEINPELRQKDGLSDETMVSFLKMEDVSHSAIVTRRRVRKYKEVKKGYTSFENDDVLLAKITPCMENGKGAHVQHLRNGVGFGSTEFHVVRARAGACSSYLFQLLKSRGFRIIAKANMIGSTGQRRVPAGFLSAYQTAFPPLREQERIASVLTSVDGVIEKIESQTNKLQELKKGLLQSLLLSGIGHTAFKDSPVGRIPRGWDTTTLSGLSTIKGGKRMPRATPFADSKTRYPYVRVSDFSDGTIRTDQLKYVRPEEHAKISRYTISKDDLYISTAGTPGIVGTVPDELDKALLTENAAKIVFKDKQVIDKRYFKFLLQSDVCQKQFVQSKGIGGGAPKLALFRIEDIHVVVPPKNEQSKIADALDSLDNRIYRVRQKLSASKAIKGALMQDLLTGAVRVKVN